MTSEIARVVNRTAGPLTVTFDGRHVALPPGESSQRLALVGHAKRQHKIMGTENPLDPNVFESLIACPQDGGDSGDCPNCRGLLGHDCSPAKQSKAIEALNAKLLPKGAKRQTVKVNDGFSRALVAADLPEDAHFGSNV